MPKGIPNKKPEEANGEHTISKMEAMRRALAKKGTDCKPVEYQSYIKSKFNVEMTTDMISNYKSSLLKAMAEASAAAPTSAVPAKSAGGFSLNELEAVKALADKIGAEKVKQLAQALAK